MFALTATPQGQQHEHHQRSDDTAEASAGGHQMMEMDHSMMADMEAMDARLDELMSVMNTATGDARVDAMSDVISLLVEQRSAMRERMQSHMAMCPMMTGEGVSHEGDHDTDTHGHGSGDNDGDHSGHR